MDFYLNILQDALTILENRANSVQMRLAEAEARITGEIAHANSYFHNPDFTELLTTLPLNSLALSAQLESLQLAADYAVGFVNARGAVSVARLHDVPNRAREIALYGVRHGVVVALAVV